MLISDKKWCPHVRIDNNRLHNSLTGGFSNSEKMNHCIGRDCMGWRQFHLTHYRGGEEELQGHGYCGFAGKIELEQRRRICGAKARMPAANSLGSVNAPCRR